MPLNLRNHFFPHLILWISLVASITSPFLIISQAYHPSYRPHLQVDVATFHQRAKYFLKEKSWSNLGHNEYQPGALWFFVATAHLAANPSDFNTFLTALILTNSALLAALLMFTWRHSNPQAALILALLIAASGPILLYRFEVLVALITLIAWYLFRHQRIARASFLLGLASAIKVYPIILLPLLLGETIRHKAWARSLQVGAAFIIGLALPTFALVATGATLTDIKNALTFHSAKPIVAEGLIGQGVILGQKILNLPLRITPGNGVHGFTSDIPLITNNMLNYLWIPLLSLLYLYLWRHHKDHSPTDPLNAFLVLLIFVIFSKVVNPQYLWWPFIFLPFLASHRFKHHSFYLVIISALSALLLTTYLYPLHFDELLAWLNNQDSNPSLFYYGVARNILLLIITILSLHAVSNHQKST